MPKITNRSLLVIGDEELLLEPGKLLLSEIIAAEKASQLTWPQILLGLDHGQARAIQTVVWILRKRHNPRLQLRDVDFSMEDYWNKDPDFLPGYWIPDGDDDQLPGEDEPADAEQDADSEDPKDPEEDLPQKAPDLG